MAVFYVFKIVQMVPNHVTHHVISMLLVLSDNYLSFCQVYFMKGRLYSFKCMQSWDDYELNLKISATLLQHVYICNCIVVSGLIHCDVFWCFLFCLKRKVLWYFRGYRNAIWWKNGLIEIRLYRGCLSASFAKCFGILILLNSCQWLLLLFTLPDAPS